MFTRARHLSLSWARWIQSSVPQLVCAANFYKKLFIRTLQLQKGNILHFVIRIRNKHHTGSSSIVSSNMCYVLFSNVCILIGQGFICRYIFMAMHIFVPPFREAKFFGVPSRVFDILGCAAGEQRLPNTALVGTLPSFNFKTNSNIILPSTPRLSKFSFFQTTMYAFLIYPMRATCPSRHPLTDGR
jgi:hypothetical protein